TGRLLAARARRDAPPRGRDDARLADRGRRVELDRDRRTAGPRGRPGARGVARARARHARDEAAVSPSAGLSRSDPPGIAATRALPCALLALALVLAAGCATSRRPEP